MPVPLRLDHVAFPSFDLEATDRFYRGMLGLRLVFALSGHSEEWGGRFALASYALGGGTALDFFALEGAARPAPDGLPADIRHVALAVDSLAALAALRERLDAHGVSFTFEEHGGAHHSLYVTDPDGRVVEFTCWLQRPGEAAAAHADATLATWIAEQQARARAT